jgi:hypothetical protein
MRTEGAGCERTNKATAKCGRTNEANVGVWFEHLWAAMIVGVGGVRGVAD